MLTVWEFLFFQVRTFPAAGGMLQPTGRRAVLQQEQHVAVCPPGQRAAGTGWRPGRLMEEALFLV